ncbi:Hint domain-containing protein [Gluconobacter sphaericus]|uniref:Hint domain-containing protein n=1 Tax=Gluconobacter sphaericus TaxID=574987 RepID=UPI00312BB7BA
MTGFIVNHGQTSSGLTLSDGDTSVILAGGTATNTTVSSGGEIFVSAFGSAAETTVSSGGEIIVSAYGTATDTTVSSGGTLFLLPGASAIGTSGGGTIISANLMLTSESTGEVISGGAGSDFNSITVSSGQVLAIYSGGETTGITIDSGGTGFVSGGGAATDTNIDGGFVSAYGSLTNTTVNSGGVLTFLTGASVSGTTTVSSGGTLKDEGAYLSNITISSGGSGSVDYFGQVVDTTVESGGEFFVSAYGTMTDTTISGGTVFVSSTPDGGATGGATLSGVTTVTSGGVLEIEGSVQGDAVIDLSSGATLVIDSDTMPSNVVSGLSDGGRIDLKNLKSVDSVSAASSSTVISGTNQAGDAVTYTLDIAYTDEEDGSYGEEIVSDDDGGFILEACFLTGSMIKTPGGDAAVETLGVGDEVVTFIDGSPQIRHVTWAGKAHCVVRPHLPLDQAGYPIRFRKDALSDGVPLRDLLVTSEHCLLLDGRFVPARMLVNGRSIFYDRSITSYAYHHIETASHSVIMAEGALTESYLDTGNRRAFRQKGAVVAIPTTRNLTWDDAAAPLCVSRDFVEPLFRQAEARAVAAGVAQEEPPAELTDEADLHLVTDAGAIIRPARQNGGRAIFMIPASAHAVRIVSRASRPCDVIGAFVDDRRYFGVAVGEIMLFESRKSCIVTSHLGEPDLKGWNALSGEDVRWTTGDALLPLDGRDPNSIAVMAVEIRAAGPYALNRLGCETSFWRALPPSPKYRC